MPENTAKQAIGLGAKACQGLVLATSLNACWGSERGTGRDRQTCSGIPSPRRQEELNAQMSTPEHLGKETGMVAAANGYHKV